MIDRFDDHICAVCARTGAGFGYAPGSRMKPLWTCDDFDCIPIAKSTYNMRQQEFTRLESLAAGEGGSEGGQFLDEIGVFDLRELTPDQFFEFNRRVVAGYRKKLVELLKDEAPF